MPSHSYDFDDGFQCEDGGEQQIHNVQGVGVCIWHTVVLDGHGDHVEEYEDDDRQLKLCTDRHVKEKALDSIL